MNKIAAVIRKAQPQDIDGLIRLLRQILDLHYKNRPDIFVADSQKYAREEIEDILKDENRPIFVAADNNNHILGYCFCKLHRPNHSVLRKQLTLYIDDFCVEEALRGQGVGKKLFDAVLIYAREQGAYNIDLNVWSFNETAIKFYENLGFSTRRQTMELILRIHE